MDNRIMTDKEVAAFFGISKATLQRRLRTPADGELDLKLADPQIVGGRRFWIRANVERVAGLAKGAK